LRRITRSKVYGVLTNRAYLGILAIHKRDKAGYEEVPAAWEPIIMDAEIAQEMMLTWLRNVASNGEKFRELATQGKERIRRQINELPAEAEKREAEVSGLRKQIEARIQELTRARAAVVRESIEKSIVGLEEERKEAEGRRALVGPTIAELEGLRYRDKILFAAHQSRIQEVLCKHEDERKTALAGLITSLLLEEGGIKIALSGVNQKALRSSVLVFAPPLGRA